MGNSLLADAFAHHVWATLRLIDTCLPLDSDQLDAEVLGIYGSTIATLRHLVGADFNYLSALANGQIIDEASMNLSELRSAMEGNGTAWASLLSQDLDPDSIVIRHRDDGSQSHAPVGIRLAQALHHGTDHRSQVCTALTAMGIEPPAIDVWDFAEYQGRLVEVPPPF